MQIIFPECEWKRSLVIPFCSNCHYPATEAHLDFPDLQDFGPYFGKPEVTFVNPPRIPVSEPLYWKQLQDRRHADDNFFSDWILADDTE